MPITARHVIDALLSYDPGRPGDIARARGLLLAVRRDPDRPMHDTDQANLVEACTRWITAAEAHGRPTYADRGRPGDAAPVPPAPVPWADLNADRLKPRDLTAADVAWLERLSTDPAKVTAADARHLAQLAATTTDPSGKMMVRATLLLLVKG